MPLVNIQDVEAASFLHGLGKQSKITGQFQTSSFTFFSGERRNFEAPVQAIPGDADDVASITLMKFSGVGNSDVNGQWLLVPGTTFFRNSTPSYDVQAIVYRRSDGQHILVQLVNPTFASNQTPPVITVDYKTIFFRAPW